MYWSIVQPSSTAGKAPSKTGAKAPVTQSGGDKTIPKPVAKPAPEGGEKKKRRKVRKETYSSYIYKGTSAHVCGHV